MEVCGAGWDKGLFNLRGQPKKIPTLETYAALTHTAVS